MDANRALGDVKVKLEGSKLTSTSTDANGNYSFTDLREGGSYTVTPNNAKINFTPDSRSFTNLRQDESAHFSGVLPQDSTPTEVCTDADKARQTDKLLNRYGAIWQQSIESEKARIISETKARSLPGVKAEVVEATASLSRISYDAIFVKGCSPHVVTASYEWQVRMFFNGTTKLVVVPKQKTCGKVIGVWICR